MTARKKWEPEALKRMEESCEHGEKSLDIELF